MLVVVRNYPSLVMTIQHQPDCTGVRDYIHVIDLAKGHVAALGEVNLGTGKGISSFGISGGNAKGHGYCDSIRGGILPSRRCGDNVCGSEYST